MFLNVDHSLRFTKTRRKPRNAYWRRKTKEGKFSSLTLFSYPAPVFYLLTSLAPPFVVVVYVFIYVDNAPNTCYSRYIVYMYVHTNDFLGLLD